MFDLQPLVDVVKRAGVFKRNETSLEVKVLAAVLCFAGLSYRVWRRLLVVYPMGWCIGLSQRLGMLYPSLRGGIVGV